MSAPHPPRDIDVTKPSVARLYDYALGGRDNYAIDREAGDRVFEVAPEMPHMARISRSWLKRVVTAMVADYRIDQFVDIGSGLPTVENVHEVAQRINPKARIVYVDNDPSVTIHGRFLLGDNPGTAYFEGDARDPEHILGEETRKLIDFSRPVGLIFSAILPFVGDEDDPPGLLARYAAFLPHGSYIAVSHPTDELDDEVRARLEGLYQGDDRINLRSREQIRSLAGDLRVLDPGLVPARQWRNPAPEPPGPMTLMAMLLYKP